MAKFSFRKPRIISKKFPEMISHIDEVTKSLEGLVFSYSEQVNKALQKKHVMMAVSSLVLLIVLGSFISPKGKAESSIFYPEACLGGWINPHYAEGMPETTSNGDASQFTTTNSAILPKNTEAEMYCGSFKGKFDPLTKPTKIIVSLALTKGEELILEEKIDSGNFASSSGKILDVATSTDISFTLIASTTNSTSTSDLATTTIETKDVSTSQEKSIATPVTVRQEGISIMNGIIQSVNNAIDTVLQLVPKPVEQTDTVIVTPPDSDTQSSSSPQSYFPILKSTILSQLVDTVFAEENTVTPVTSTVITSTIDSSQKDTYSIISDNTLIQPQDILKVVGATNTAIVSENASAISIDLSGTSSINFLTKGIASTTNASSSNTVSEGQVIVTSTTSNEAINVDDNQFQNNFLEVLYTFDGVTWNVLGDLNEISMKYRTFEIPVTASTSWKDMSQLQIKVQSKKHFDETPTVYLDGIKVEVLYETTVIHEHPDFARDVILKEISDEDIHVINIINSDTGHDEIWRTTVSSQGEYGVAPGTWVQINLNDFSTSTKLIAVYGENIFWKDDNQNLLWGTNIKKETNNGIGIIPPVSTSRVIPFTATNSSMLSVSTSTENNISTSTTITVITAASTTLPFVKENGEEWIFEYNSATNIGIAKKNN